MRTQLQTVQSLDPCEMTNASNQAVELGNNRHDTAILDANITQIAIDQSYTSAHCIRSETLTNWLE